MINQHVASARSGISLVFKTGCGVHTLNIIFFRSVAVGSLDNFACSQLTKLESNYPIIRKPTGEVSDVTRLLNFEPDERESFCELEVDSSEIRTAECMWPVDIFFSLVGNKVQVLCLLELWTFD